MATASDIHNLLRYIDEPGLKFFEFGDDGSPEVQEAAAPPAQPQPSAEAAPQPTIDIPQGSGAFAPRPHAFGDRGPTKMHVRVRLRPPIAAAYPPPPTVDGPDQTGDDALSKFFKKL